MLYIGVDPGAAGGMAAIDSERNILFVYPMSRENLVNFVNEIHEKCDLLGDTPMACVEKVGAMPGQGVTSMFNFGKNAGFIEGVFETAKIPYQLVAPAKWKKEFSLLHKDKKDSIAMCRQLFPDVNLLPSTRHRKESDGMAEALLCAEYARRKL